MRRPIAEGPSLAPRLAGAILALLLAGLASPAPVSGQENAECLACHEERSLTGTRGGKRVSMFVNAKALTGSAHAEVPCVACHADIEGKELPHPDDLAPVDCGSCHGDLEALHAKSLHGRAIARNDPLAPRCTTCHGAHAVLPKSNPRSPMAPLNIPFLCGQCHQEGTPVTRLRTIHQDHILENYSESIHGEGLLRKGLIVAPSCTSCHTPHSILPHTDPASSISRRNIAATCATCHAEIEAVHRKVIKGELWEREEHVLPACVDCHQPHKIRRVFYTQGMADSDCMRCHSQSDLRATDDGRPLQVHQDSLLASRHGRVACSQCHSEVSPSRIRPCETITTGVNCSSCHAAADSLYRTSTHGILEARQDPNGPTCTECHGTHGTQGRLDPLSPTFPTNIPTLCGQCHREGEPAAVRYIGAQHEIVEHYTESIHGKGLLKSGLTVTATCTNCHTAHGVLPTADSASSVNPRNLPTTCGNCHHGIQEQFEKSIHSASVSQSGKPLPTCADCHSAHTIARADQEGFKLEIMTQCGRCHEDVATTYFDTYHGKVSQLGYTKTAKCYDCHGAHDILPVSDPASTLSRENVVGTCQKCHPGATRRFAGYLTHATHHDPDKYPWLFWTFWGMTTLLVGTFTISGLHTLLWLPRALKMRRELNAAREQQASTEEPS